MIARPISAMTTVTTLRRTSTEEAYRTLRQMILDNQLTPGSQHLEQALVDMLELSRTPVREALIRLENEGLVEVIPRHGIRILPMSASDMHEIYELLAILEPAAAELVAQRRPTAEELDPFDRACNDMAAALDRDDREAWAVADEAYHLHLLKLCGNRRLAETVMKCWDQAHRARYFTLSLRPKPVQSVIEHRAITDAIRTGNAATAREIYRRHRERGGQEQMDILTKFKIHQV